MTVQIKRIPRKDNTIAACDMVEGNAYEDAGGIIYICNRYDSVIAFSICGRFVISAETTVLTRQRFREVNITITEEN
jgi:hypothetical protein